MEPTARRHLPRATRNEPRGSSRKLASANTVRHKCMTIRTQFLVLALLGVGACNQQKAFERLIPREDVEYSRRVFQAIQQRDFGAVESLLNPNIRDATTRTKLVQVADVFPRESPKEVRVIGAQTNVVGDTTYVNLTLEYEFPSGWVLGNILLEKRPGRNIVNGLHVEPAADSQQRLNRFSLTDRSVLHYVVLGWAATAPVFILGVLTLAIRTSLPRGKWLWVVFILFGVCQVSLNWTSGQLGFNPISVALLASGFAKPGPYAPVIISTSFPLGAAVFVWKRRALANKPLQPTSGAETGNAARG
jgi:hypothetical protein